MIGLVDGNNFYVSCERVVNPKLNGKPVAVLSNNDGCCVAMSPEFKALGIARGTPYYQLKDREVPKGDLIFCSSNYELYGDISRRIIQVLRERAVEVEQYSIDEAFIWPPSVAGNRDQGIGIGIWNMVRVSGRRFSNGSAFPAASGSLRPRPSPRSPTTLVRNARRACS